MFPCVLLVVDCVDSKEVGMVVTLTNVFMLVVDCVDSTEDGMVVSLANISMCSAGGGLC